MTSLSQSPRDRILWILAAHGRKMERSRLRRCMGVEKAYLDTILEDMAKEGKIRVTVDKHGNMVPCCHYFLKMARLKLVAVLEIYILLRARVIRSCGMSKVLKGVILRF
jgi:hypothetical protein